MRRKIVVGVVVCLSLGLNVALLLPYFGQEAVFAGTPSGNEDVNGSGGIDTADAIYILSCLFAKGPLPEETEHAGGGVPATGQTACYDTDGNVIDCMSVH